MSRRANLSPPIVRMLTGVAALAAVFVIATIGFMIAGWSPGDAAYMVVITTFGVGYGEVRPVGSTPLRLLTIAMIVTGYGALIYTGGGFIQLLVDGELNRALGARRMAKDIDQLSDHTIVCGFGRMGTTLARELHAAGQPFVAIDTLGGASSLADDAGYLVIAGDATEEGILERAGIERARTLAAVTADDATNVFVTLTARQMNPDLTIIARGEQRGTEDKLRICGADTVVMTTSIGASKILQLITRPTVDELLDRLTRSADGGADLDQIGLEFDELLIGSDSPLVDKTLGEIEVRGAHGYLIVGIRRADGSTIMHPPTSTEVYTGDVLVVLGYGDDIPELGARLSSSASRTPSGRTYRGVSY